MVLCLVCIFLTQTQNVLSKLFRSFQIFPPPLPTHNSPRDGPCMRVPTPPLIDFLGIGISSFDPKSPPNPPIHLFLPDWVENVRQDFIVDVKLTRRHFEKKEKKKRKIQVTEKETKHATCTSHSPLYNSPYLH